MKNTKSNKKSHTSPLPSKYRYLNGRGDELDERAVNAAKQGLRALDEARLDEAITWFTDAIGYCRSIKAESREVETTQRAAHVPTKASMHEIQSGYYQSQPISATDKKREENIAVWGDPKGR